MKSSRGSLVLCLLVSLILYFPFNVEGQATSKKFAFQVMVAENATSAKLGLIKSLDVLGEGDTVAVKNGVLAMVHENGYPVEISQDSVIVISKISNLIKAYKELNGYFSMGIANLDLLFVRSPAKVREWLSKRGIIDDINPFVVYYPPISRVNLNDDVCLTWSPIKGASYVARVRDMYDDEFLRIPSSTNEVRFSMEQLEETKVDRLLVSVKPSKGGQEEDRLGIHFIDVVPFPFPCDLEKPSVAILAALNMEWSRQPYLDGAEKYYLLATRLSNNPFYAQMLDNFKKRRKRR